MEITLTFLALLLILTIQAYSFEIGKANNEIDISHKINATNKINHKIYSQPTSIKESECTGILSKSFLKYFSNKGTHALKCQSMKKWQPYLVSTMERSWIDLIYGQTI